MLTFPPRSLGRKNDHNGREHTERGSHPNAAAAVGGSYLGGGATSGGIAAAVGLPMVPPVNGGTNNASVATRRASKSNGQQQQNVSSTKRSGVRVVVHGDAEWGDERLATHTHAFRNTCARVFSDRSLPTMTP